MNSKTLYIRVNIDQVYRIDLTRACAALATPDAQLILNVHGGSTICSAADLTLSVSQPFLGIPEPCFVKSMTRLSPAEVAAPPGKLRP